MDDRTRDEMILSYYRVRQALGFLGVLFPFLLMVPGLISDARIMPSLSDYYHSMQRDIFVGSLVAIGMFLVSYKGHVRAEGERLSDDFVATLAGAAAILIALCPSEPPEPAVVTFSQFALGLKAAVIGHYISAQVFLYALAYMCLFKFARTAKPVRRRIYRGCGFLIVAMGVVASIAAYHKALGSESARAFVLDNSVVFWCEAVGVWAFGVSWLVKGRAEMLLLRRPARAGSHAAPAR
ncbi:hypothetical protein GLS40_01780 [Pseudooceanicola sp. 216_PA32_1]|uniref:DUF998 domain-containing protein n=1 Tax=Pseudooceanicola pacificus TaxID=2676438 RepID=A0A844W8H1_9RHOB|nr:hypothetical protein [Pseudooceanicola pacificus]MWB76748.1 hypothetical protein [Pseudooceanicola pacificus]